MSRDISQGNLDQLYALNSTSTEVLLLRVIFGSETIYLARDFIDVTYGGRLYTAMPFDITLPDENENGSNSAELKIADVMGDIYGRVRTVETIMAEFEIISVAADGAQDSIALFQNMRLSTAVWEEASATFNLFREDEGIYMFPRNNMDNILLPGLY